MVASVPELPNRHSGSPHRCASSVGDEIASSVGCAKCVPSSDPLLDGATMAGCACPARETPYPPWKSLYSVPSTSKTWEPEPWLIQTACGSAICQFEVAPPASTPWDRSINARDCGLAIQEDLALFVDQRVQIDSGRIRSRVGVDGGHNCSSAV